MSALGRFLHRIIPSFIKYGPIYSHHKSLIRKENLTDNKIIDMLQKRILYANKAPFYNQLYKTHKIDIQGIKSISDFQILPIISKKDIIRGLGNFINKNYSLLSKKMNTGGTTGSPMSFYVQKFITRPKEKAYFDSMWSCLGYSHRDLLFSFRGKTFKSLFKYSFSKNSFDFSSYHLKPEYAHSIQKLFHQFRPKFIAGYPSTILQLVKLFKNMNLRINNIQGVFLGSEHLFDVHKQEIESFFGTQTLNWYGHSERCVLLKQVKNGCFVNYDSYGFCEIINEDGKSPDGLIIGRLVVTNYDNNVMPFIRYDTGDIVTGKVKDGRVEYVTNIEGRNQDYIFDSDNNSISLTALFHGQHYNVFSQINQIQFYQDKIGKITIKIVKGSVYEKSQEDQMLEIMKHSTFNKIVFNVEYVNNLGKYSNGKVPLLISEVN